jgi:ketosteroid isomerase-like protein
MQRGKPVLLLGVLLVLSQFHLFAQDSDKMRVLALENAWNEAESHNDTKALASLLAPTFVYTDAEGSVMDRDQLLASVRASRSTQIVNEGMKAESYGTAMVVTGSYREQGTENGKAYTHRGRFTDTWILRDGQWLCAASQETLIAH